MRLTNTLTGRVEEFHPVTEGNVGIYVCGVTPYDVAHVGHAMSLMVYDVLVRYLRWAGNPAGGYDVTFVSNYTDVDDKLIERAREQGREPLELSNANIDQWEAEQVQLGLTLPDVRPRVTLEIDHIVAMIEEIIAHGLAYVTPHGDIYFRVREKRDYGKLSHRNIDELRQGTRFEPGEEKEFALDFALWKAAQPDKYGADEPVWDSPWGKGRPGWHIECSAMSRRYLGERFDIHGGGLDLVFPHHENEIAQAEAAAGVDGGVFANLWMHNGMVTRDNTKMSKSIGNVVTVQEALERWSIDAIRLFVLNSHYRAANNLTDEAMAAATAGVQRLTAALRPSEPWEMVLDAMSSTSYREIDLPDYRRRFIEALEDDLHTPRALSMLFNLARAINRAREGGHDVTAAQAELREQAGVLGLALPQPSGAAAEEQLDAVALSKLAARLGVSCGGTDAASTIEALIAARADARAARDFARSDEIRDALADLGVTLEDGVEGTRWSVR
ncbi:MAG: cysteine--tRNA ligase [Chloroflexi bacterium]|nr:cysteine--tRNA ligase [Chloroflexota bacterium]